MVVSFVLERLAWRVTGDGRGFLLSGCETELNARVNARSRSMGSYYFIIPGSPATNPARGEGKAGGWVVLKGEECAGMNLERPTNTFRLL